MSCPSQTTISRDLISRRLRRMEKSWDLMTLGTWIRSSAPPRFPTSMVTRESLNIGDIPLRNWQRSQHSFKCHFSSYLESSQQQHNSKLSLRKLWPILSFTVTSITWWNHSDMMLIPWVCSVQPLLPYQLFILNRIQVLLVKISIKTRSSGTNKFIDCWEMCQLWLPMHTATESEGSITFLQVIWATSKTSYIWWIDSMKMNSFHILNWSGRWRFCSFCMPNTNLTAQLLPWGKVFCYMQTSMFIWSRCLHLYCWRCWCTLWSKTWWCQLSCS